MKSRDKLIPIVALSGALLGGCAIGGQSTPSFAQTSGPVPRNHIYYFSGFKTVDRDYIRRYACEDRRIMACTCMSPHGGSCDCSC